MRASKLDSTGFVYYDWDGINVIQEKDGAGSVTDRQVHGYAPVVSVGDIAHMDKSGSMYVPTSDQVGTIWNLLDASATKSNSYTYDAFGVGRSASETVSNVYRFATKHLSADTHMYYFVLRRYSPVLGRFINPEYLIGPWLRTAHYNGYAYAQQNPLTFVDPMGRDEIRAEDSQVKWVFEKSVPWYLGGWFWQANVCETTVGKLIDDDYVKLDEKYVKMTVPWSLLKKEAHKVLLGSLPEAQREAKLRQILKGLRGRVSTREYTGIRGMLKRILDIISEAGGQAIGPGGMLLAFASKADLITAGFCADMGHKRQTDMLLKDAEYNAEEDIYWVVCKICAEGWSSLSKSAQNTYWKWYDSRFDP